MWNRGYIEHFQAIKSSPKKVGLKINYDKTEIMIRNVDNPKNRSDCGKVSYESSRKYSPGMLMIWSISVTTLHTAMWTSSDVQTCMEEVLEVSHGLEI